MCLQNDFWLLVCWCLNRILLMNPFRSPQQVLHLHIDNRVVCFANRDTVFAHKDVFAIISAEPLCNCKIELYRFLTRFWWNSQFGCSSWWWGQAALHIICIQVSLSFDIVSFFYFFTFYTSQTNFLCICYLTQNIFKWNLIVWLLMCIFLKPFISLLGLVIIILCSILFKIGFCRLML